jgi:hypothetical protein
MDDDTSEVRSQTPKPEPTPGPTDAELSRIARQAVHQLPDARLDKQLARMGLLDEPTPAEPRPGQQASPSVAIDPELERLRGQLRRARLILWVLVAVSAVLAVVVVALLIR